jgi:DNA-binding NarL/FixJ family response regulator
METSSPKPLKSRETMQISPMATPLGTTIPLAIAADSHVTREALTAIVSEDAEIEVLGSAADIAGAEAFLDRPSLRVMLVNMSLGAEGRPATGLELIERCKARRPDVGVLSLKHVVDESLLRAALDAGADACCLATTPQARLLKAVKAVAEGATWLDPEISRVLLHPRDLPAAPHLSPRERSILRLIVDGYSNSEIAGRLDCATATVHTHVLNLFRKLGVHDRVSAAVTALRCGLV